MGFGHRVYKSYDPRARIIKQTADEVFEVDGQESRCSTSRSSSSASRSRTTTSSAASCIRTWTSTPGLIYQAMGFPVDMFPVLFAIPRTAGWLAQWDEMLRDPDQKIARPRQIYIGRRTARLRRRSTSDRVSNRCNARCKRHRVRRGP